MERTKRRKKRGRRKKGKYFNDHDSLDETTTENVWEIRVYPKKDKTLRRLGMETTNKSMCFVLHTGCSFLLNLRFRRRLLKESHE